MARGGRKGSGFLKHFDGLEERLGAVRRRPRRPARHGSPKESTRCTVRQPPPQPPLPCRPLPHCPAYVTDRNDRAGWLNTPLRYLISHSSTPVLADGGGCERADSPNLERERSDPAGPATPATAVVVTAVWRGSSRLAPACAALATASSSKTNMLLFGSHWYLTSTA